MDSNAAAAHLRARREPIGLALAALVAQWPKYAAQYAADPALFAELEAHTLVDYAARHLEAGDDVFQNLYIGEKAKQFHDRTVSDEEARRRGERLLSGEHAIFTAELAGFPDSRSRVDRMFADIAKAISGTAKAEVKALFVGDCLYLDLIGFVTAPALADGVRLKSSFITSHNAAEIRSKAAALADEGFDVVFYSPFTYAFLSDYEALHRPRQLKAPTDAWRRVDSAVATGLEIFDTLADLFDCPLVAHLPAPIQRGDGQLRERGVAALTLPLRARATRRLNAGLRLRAEARKAAGQVVHLLDERAVAGTAGLDAAGRYLFRSAMQHPAAFGAMLAPWYRDILMVIGRLAKRKLVACDLDNTLWDGVIGEGLGVVHRPDRQAPLQQLKARGVVLAINSKNDPAKVVWTAPEGCLSLDDFVSRQINWDPKPLNMARIAAHLNLKEKDFVFIDDRADERAQVEARFPDMLLLDALDPRSWRLLGLWADLLPAKPDADRTAFYRQRDARQAFIAADAGQNEAERAQALQELGLCVTIREAQADDCERVAELVNRTNQFNTTGARVSKREVAALTARGDAWVLLAEAADRFGRMGTISVLIARRNAGGVVISAFVLSCRVFGYGMEQALLEQARRLCRPGDALVGPLVETPLNQPCRDVYPTAGFHQSDADWRLDDPLSAAIAVPGWLTVDARIDHHFAEA